MTDDRTAHGPDDAPAVESTPPPQVPAAGGTPPDAAPEPTAPEPTAPQPAAPQPTAPLPSAPQGWPSPPQAWPSPSAPTQPAWGSPVPGAAPGDPGAPEWASPAPASAAPVLPVPQGAPVPASQGAPAWGSPAGPAVAPAGYPYGVPGASAAPAGAPAYGSPAGYGPPSGYAPQTPWGTPPGYPAGRRPMSAGKVVGLVVAGLVVVLALVVAGTAALFSSGRTGSARGPVVTEAPSFGGGQGGQQGGGQSPDQTLPSVPATPVPDVPSPTSSAAKAYVASANQFCRATTDPALKAAQPLSSADLPQYLRVSATINRALDARLRQGVPDELKGTVEEITKGWDGLSDNYEKAAKAIESGDATSARRYLALADASNDYGNAVAKKIGMDDCADAGGIGGTGSGTPTPGVTA